MATKCSSLYIPALCCCLLFSFNFISCLQNATDRLALTSFRESIQRDPYGVLNSWNDSLHFCDWHGVSCSQRHPDRVVALILNSQGLVGSLSPHIGNLSFLNYIDFQNNSFHGPIPQEICYLRRLRYIQLSNNSFQGNIPTNFSSNLIYLNLIDNKLVGSIPVELGSLLKLRALSLTKNNLTGNIPSFIGNLSSLQRCSLGTNNFQGHIPEEFSRLNNLFLFIVKENFLIGEIPVGLFNISGLKYFSVEYNSLKGRIPSDIGLTLPEMTILALGGNNISGHIPVSLSNASKLEQIFLSFNHVSGLIPRDLGKLPHLLVIEFSNNQLEDDLSFIDSLINCSNLLVINVAANYLRGSIPISVANLSQLNVISLAANQVQGAVPKGLENLVNLQFLLLHDNHLTGPIQINFNNFQQLLYLTLNMNRFTGTIPSSFGNSTMLSHLYMQFNNLNGSIPPSIGSCHNLIGLDLSHNSLSGSIPKEVIGLSSLAILLDLSANQLSGPVPSEVSLLKNLVKLDLSDNRLSGTIPISIGKCSSLEELYLHSNAFQGNIPTELSSLKGLAQLDISGNNLSGLIPESLAELKGLKYLNLSFNQLQSQVPKRGVFLNESAVSLLGNNGLCGGINQLKLPSCLSQESKKNISFALKVVIPVAAMFSVVLAFFLIFWRFKTLSRKRNISIPLLEHQFMRISYAELFKATDGFFIANIIGVGGYGSVYKGILEGSGMQIAVKVLNLQQRGASSSFISECEALRSIRHRNLLKLLSICSSLDFQGNDFKALIYEFMTNGSLEKWLHTGRGGEDGQQTETTGLKVMQRLNIAIDVAAAVEYLHNGSSSTIVHGDLKPSNVLLDEEMTAHIGDFGLAKIVSSTSSEIQQHQSTSRAFKGSVGYAAPEYGVGNIISTKGDVYSYGILLLEIFTGKKPTDEQFKDDLNLRTFVERCLPDRVMDIVEPRILFDDERESLRDCMVSALRIGIACSMEQSSERMEMKDAITELQKIKDSLLKKGLN